MKSSGSVSFLALRSARRLALPLRLAFALVVCTTQAAAQSQSPLVTKAFDLEQAGRARDAIAAWRAVIAAGEGAQGVLGLERVFAGLAQDDSVLPVVDSLVARSPGDRVLRGVQLRVLHAAGRDADARKAFEEWAHVNPTDPNPYREYASQLLGDSRIAAADTVLQQASIALGNTKALQAEVAQLRAGLGRWSSSAVAWRDAIGGDAYLEQSAVYSLGQATGANRDSVRAVLRVAPTAPIRKVLGALELQWGAPREGWQVLSQLAPADSGYQSWADFAEDAERLGAWLPARDALVAMNRQRPATGTTLRAANAALTGGEPASAIELLAAAAKGMQPFQFRTQILPLQVRALSQLGRSAEAEKLVKDAGDNLDPRTRQAYARQIAWGWIRAGQVEKARAALAGASGEDEDEVTAWIALYDGDLKGARAGLRRPADATADVVSVMALLARTTADSSRTVGAAFLALARGDSAQAAARFERAADEISDAAPLLLALSARVQAARRQDGAAITLWQRIVQRYAEAPEAAEADLEWGRSLRRKGDVAGAVERFEHLILSYPQSALVPQARRELDAVRTGATGA